MDRFGAGYTLLLVDDDPGLLPSLIAMIESLSDFKVVTADNGVLGLESIYHVRPHCIVVDVRMPELDGIQLVKLLRGDPETAQIPVIMLTAMVQTKDRFAGLAAGADAYLLKPVKPLDLLAAIRSAIVRSEQDRVAAQRALAEEQNS